MNSPHTVGSNKMNHECENYRFCLSQDGLNIGISYLPEVLHTEYKFPMGSETIKEGVFVSIVYP